VEDGGGGPMGGERGVGLSGWKERRAAAGPCPEPGLNSKRNYFQISIDFRIWHNLESCIRRFRRNFDMGIFPKIF
jgi:hypothetical protein